MSEVPATVYVELDSLGMYTNHQKHLQHIRENLRLVEEQVEQCKQEQLEHWCEHDPFLGVLTGDDGDSLNALVKQIRLVPGHRMCDQVMRRVLNEITSVHDNE
jgi:hypothetical protein